MTTKTDSGVALLELPTQANAREKGDKRINLILTSTAYEDLAALAKERRTTMTEIVRLALGLIKVAIREADQGNKLVVAKANGDVLKELILPG